MDIMIDIETLGVNPGSAILSIAAVKFNIKTGEVLKELYVVVDLKSCLESGLKIEASTFYWWMNQSEEARIDILKPSMNLSSALQSLSTFINKENVVWGNSARFDLGLLNKAYEVLGIDLPWSFRNERCVRTIVALNQGIRDEEEFIGVAHNPIDDCKHQIKYLVKTINSLNNN